MVWWFFRNLLVFVGVALPVICVLETLLLGISQGTSDGGTFSGNPVAAPFELLMWSFLLWLTVLAPAAASAALHALVVLGLGVIFGGATPRWLSVVSTLIIPLAFIAFVRLALTSRPSDEPTTAAGWLGLAFGSAILLTCLAAYGWFAVRPPERSNRAVEAAERRARTLGVVAIAIVVLLVLGLLIAAY